MKRALLLLLLLLLASCGPEVLGADAGVCVPWCHAVHAWESQCGSDGCGGWCGDCAAGQACLFSGTPSRGLCEDRGT